MVVKREGDVEKGGVEERMERLVEVIVKSVKWK